MFVLHQFPKTDDGLNMSPFCLKMECWFQHMGVAFEDVAHTDALSMPKQKLPVLEDKGKKIADSQFIIDHLREVHGLDADSWMTPQEQAIAHSFRLMAEERMYWIVVWQRWAIDSNWQELKRHFFGSLPPIIKDILAWKVRKTALQTLWGQGMTRHADGEIVALGKRDLDAIEAQLADNAYLMGDKFCTADAALFGIVENLRKPFDTALARDINNRPRIVAWCARMAGDRDALKVAAE